VILRLRILFSFCCRNRWSRDWWFSLVSAAAIGDPESWFYQFLQQQWAILRLVLLVSAAAIGDPESWFYQFLQQKWAILRLFLLVSAGAIGDPENWFYQFLQQQWAILRLVLLVSAAMGDPRVSSRQKSWWFFCVYVTQASKQHMQQIHLMMFTGQANMKFSQAEIAKIMKQQQQQWHDDTKHTENKPATTVRILLRDFVSCEPLISFLRVCLIFSTYILKLMAYAPYESSIVVVQQARKGWRSKTAWKLHVEKSNCNIPKNCGVGKHEVDVIISHVRMLMIYSLTNLGFALFLSLSTESTIFFSSWVAPSRNFGPDFLVFSLQQQRNSLLTWCYSDFFQQIKLLMFKQTSQQKRGQQKWEWYTQSLRLDEKSVSCTKPACKTVRICR